MFVVTVIVSLLLAVALAGSAAGKLTGNKQAIAVVRGVGVKEAQIPVLAYLEIAGAVGLLIGLFWAPLGIVAAVGVVLYFAGAVAAHLRVGRKDYLPAAGLLVLAIITLIVRSVSA